MQINFQKSKVFINIKSDNDITEVIIEDDGEGYPKDVLRNIGEPYNKSYQIIYKIKIKIRIRSWYFYR